MAAAYYVGRWEISERFSCFRPSIPSSFCFISVFNFSRKFQNLQQLIFYRLGPARGIKNILQRISSHLIFGSLDLKF